MGWPIVRIDSAMNVHEVSSEAAAILDVAADSVCDCALDVALGVVDTASFGAWAHSGWVGQDEHAWRLKTGRSVALRVQKDDTGWMVLLVEVTALLVLQDARASGDRAQAVAGLASAVSQELNDPMSIVQGRLELLEAIGTVGADHVNRHLEVALSHARRVSGTLHNLRLVGRSQSRIDVSVPLHEALTVAVALVGPRAATVHVDVLPRDLAAGADAALISRVTVDLVRSALAVNSARAGIVVKARRASAGRVRILVSTRAGRKLPESAALAIDRTLLWNAGGELVVKSAGGLSQWSLFLPAPARRRVRRHKPVGRLLVVGSDRFAAELQALLDRDGLALVVVEDVVAAMQLLERLDDLVGIVSELLLPGPSGLALVQEVRKRRPALLERLLLVTDVKLDQPAPGVRWLASPVSRLALLRGLGRRAR